MVLADDMGRNNEFPILMLIEILDKNLFIRRPTASGHKYLGRLFTFLRPFYEVLHYRELLGGIPDLDNPVETRVTHHRYARNTDLRQQFLADLILHEEMREAVQHTSVLTTIPLEKDLIRTENARHTIDRHIPMFQDMEIIIPELILDKEGHHRTHQPEESDGIDGGVQRQITDNIRPFVVFPDLITRR